MLGCLPHLLPDPAVLFRILRDLSEAAIQTKAKETSNFVESLRAMQSVKLFNRESERESQWLNRFADSVNADARLDRVIPVSKLSATLSSPPRIFRLFTWRRGSRSQNVFTIGMVFAFITYKQQFVNKASLLIEKALDFGIVRLHLERLSDIALTPLEPGQECLCSPRPVCGSLEVRNLSFRYSEAEPFILQDVNFAVGAGQICDDHGPLWMRQDNVNKDIGRAAAPDERRSAGGRCSARTPSASEAIGSRSPPSCRTISCYRDRSPTIFAFFAPSLDKRK